jgi:hypothetical protein
MVTTKARHIPLKAIALPNEHGAWGFWLEPALLGMLLAPSWSGTGLVLASLAALFLQHPLSLFLSDKRRGRIFPRTPLALQFAGIYSIFVLFGLLLTSITATSFLFLVPLVLAAPFAFTQLEHKSRNKGRSLWAELSGATAMSALAPSLLLLGDFSILSALAIWILLLVRSLPSILYVRARLRLERGENADQFTPLISSIVACGVTALLVYLKLLPVFVLPVMVVLFIRAAFGLSMMRGSTRARTVGMLELVYGLLVVGAVFIGNTFTL